MGFAAFIDGLWCIRWDIHWMEFSDVGAVIYFLRKVVWTVPGFTVEGYRDRLRELHDQIQVEGTFIAHAARTLIEARRAS